MNWRRVVKKRRPPESRPMIVDLRSANTKLVPNRLLGGVDSPCGSAASRPLKTGVLGIASAGTLVADAAPASVTVSSLLMMRVG